MRGLLFLCLLFTGAAIASDGQVTEPSPAPYNFQPNRILFLLNHGQYKEALELYDQVYKETGKHNFELLQQMSLLILDQGFKSDKPEEQMLAIFGAGISLNDMTFHLLEEGMHSPFPEIQVIALNFLGRSQNDLALSLINRAMGSPHAIIRLEACYQLALKKDPRATAQIEGLMQKMVPEVTPIFPKLFAIVGDDHALKVLRKLMTHSDHAVRVACILAACEGGRDDLLPQIRRLATQHDVRQQEAAAMAFGLFKDETSIPVLQKLTQSQHQNVRIAALASLDKLGNKQAAKQLQDIALTGDLFAIYALRDIPGSEEVLAKLAASNQLLVRINATLALLELNDRRALPGVTEILVRDARDLAFVQISTPSKALTAWRVIPSASHQGDDAQTLLELSLELREKVLTRALELPEADFIKLARLLFEKRQNDLIPILVQLLINQDSPAVIQLLKEQQQKIGAPLIRNYANLALVKLKEEGPYSDTLKNWILQQKEVDMMKFRTYVPLDMRELTTAYELNPQDSARLLVESLEMLTESNEIEGIDLLLAVMKDGHEHNRFLIAGLLLLAAQ